MRNLKKLFAVVMVVAMLASMMVPALAAGVEYEDEATILQDLGLFQGYGAGELGLADDLTREQGLALMLRVMGLEDEVKAMTEEEVAAELARVVDPETVTATWAKPYVAYAVKNGLTKGIDASILPNVKFAGQLKMTGKEFINLMLNGMGYATAWDDVLTKAAEVEMLSAGESVTFGTVKEMTRDDAVAIMTGALTGITSEGITLAQALVDAGAVDADKMEEYGFIVPEVVPTEAPVEFAVDGIASDNLKVVKINLTRPVDKDSVSRDNVKVLKDNSNIIAVDADIKVSDDKTTLFAIVPQQLQNQKVKVSVKDLKDAEGNKIVASETEVYMQDITVPEIVSFTAADAKTLEIAFSEPINYIKVYDTNLSNLKIDDKSVVGKTSFDYVKNVMTISLVNKLTEGTHKIDIKDMKDYSGLVAVSKSYDFEIVKDETPPEIVSAKFISTSVVEVEFNETIAANGKFKVNGSSEKSGSALEKDGTKKIKITGLNLGMGALVEIKVEYKDQEDVVGNKVSDWKSYTFKIEDDTTLPDVSIEVKNGGVLKFVFSKAMVTTEGKITIKKASDNSVVQTLVAPSSYVNGASGHWSWKDKDKNREVEITFNNLKNQDARDYVAVLENFKDATVRNNGMGKKEITFAGKDTKAPSVTAFAKIAAGADSDTKKDTITFYFSEEMDEDTLNNLSNYVNIKSGDSDLNKPFSAIGDVSIKEIADNGKSVVIYYKGAAAKFDTAGVPYFRVMGLKDKAGNYAPTKDVGKYGETNMTIDTTADKGIRATAKNKVEVYFTTDVKEADPSAFVIIDNTAPTDQSKWIYFNGYSIDGKKVVFTMSKDFGTTNMTNYRLSYNGTTYDNAIKEVIKDVYGNKFLTVAGPQSIVDKVKPYVKDVKELAGQKIEITVSETVYATDMTALLNSLIIRDKDNNIIAAIDGMAGTNAADWKGVKEFKDSNGAVTVMNEHNKVLVQLDFKASRTADDKPNYDGNYGTTGFDQIVLTFGSDFLYKDISVEFINRTLTDTSANVIEAYAKTNKSIKE
jgi:hypothetical protein